MGIWCWVYVYFGEGKYVSCLLVGNSGLNFRCLYEVRFVGRVSMIRVRCRDIIVWVLDFVFGVVVVLGEVFIVVNMMMFVCFIVFVGFGVVVMRRIIIGIGYCCSRLGGSFFVGVRDVKILVLDMCVGMGSECS